MAIIRLIDLFCWCVWEAPVTTVNMCLVSLPVITKPSRPEYQSRMGSRLHRTRCSGDHPRRRHWERPSWPHQQLCKSQVQKGAKSDQHQHRKLHCPDIRSDLFYTSPGRGGQLRCQRWRYWPTTKIHTAKWKQVIRQKYKSDSTLTGGRFSISCQTSLAKRPRLQINVGGKWEGCIHKMRHFLTSLFFFFPSNNPCPTFLF